eukprot:CAMPEP_0198299872 /NCGR_PEP_ID=MMETSP1449-20131203/46113_1 /TAXON_ID=420275 /ORGANISM="Attheya septentrionalis, Strain CCMP2084" /LENGTH=428 /DNA_ID=CAMNT_0044001531 /DNA_START=62 /DNA_END=1344 /DNA_ORIENTATION=-
MDRAEDSFFDNADRDQHNSEASSGLQNNALYDAIGREDWEEAIEMFARNYKADTELFLEYRDAEGRNILHCLCASTSLPTSSQIKLLKTISKQRPQLCFEQTISKQSTPLHIACVSSSNEALIFNLIQLCPGVAAVQDRYGYTPLHLAVRNNCTLTVVKYLLASYPPACLLQDCGKRTPLLCAIDNKNGIDQQILDALLQMCPKALSIPSLGGITVLHRAIECHLSSEVIYTLLSYEPAMIHARNWMANGTPLHDFFTEWYSEVRKFCASDVQYSVVEDLGAGELRTVYNISNILLRASQLGTVIPNGSQNDFFILHGALHEAECPIIFINFFLQLHPEQAMIPDQHGNLPLHHLLVSRQKWIDTIFNPLFLAYPDALFCKNNRGRTPFEAACIQSAHTKYNACDEVELVNALFQCLIRDPTVCHQHT